jgi:hypothetical protein
MIHRIKQIIEQLKCTMNLNFDPTWRFLDRLSTGNVERIDR